MRIKHFLIAYMTVFMFTACNEDIFTENIPDIQSAVMKINVRDQFSENTTRANYTGFPATTFEAGDEIGIYAFDGNAYVASNVRYTKQSDGSWLADSDIRYNEDYTYYAYFPYRSTTYTPSTAGGVSDIDTKFTNFINDASNYFWQADQSTKEGYTYSNLMIAKGNVTIDNGTPTVSFTMLHKRGLALFVDDAELVEFNGNLPYKIGSSLQFLMKPNVLTNFEYDNEACSLTACNGGYSTHKVIKWYYNLEITAPEEFTYSGGTNNYSVASYKTNKNNEIIPIAWTAQFSEDDGETWTDTPPAWLTAFTAAGNGGATVNYNATVPMSDAVSGTMTATQILQMKTPVRNMDLSDPTGIGTPQNTANCYVVSAAGTYKLPLVYGNAIKNGSDNPSAYSASLIFNSLQAAITSPYMKDNNQSPNGAEVVWKDNINNITNNDLSIKDDYLYINIRRNLAEGNVVIAIKENDNIIWTYHIWITPVDWSNTNATPIAGFAPTYVGWVNNGNLSVSGNLGHQCLVKFSQTGKGEEQIIAITQKDNIIVSGYAYDGYAPYFQYGRPVPIIPSPIISTLGSNNSFQHSAYNGNNSSVYNTCKLIQSNNTYQWKGKKDLLAEPLIIWTNVSESRNRYAGNTTWEGPSNAKTVFDPCPVGMKVPTSTNINSILNKTTTGVDNYAYKITISNKDLYFPRARYIMVSQSANVNYYAGRAQTSDQSNVYIWLQGSSVLFIYTKGENKTTYTYHHGGSSPCSIRGYAE